LRFNVIFLGSFLSIFAFSAILTILTALTAPNVLNVKRFEPFDGVFRRFSTFLAVSSVFAAIFAALVAKSRFFYTMNATNGFILPRRARRFKRFLGRVRRAAKKTREKRSVINIY